MGLFSEAVSLKMKLWISCRKLYHWLLNNKSVLGSFFVGYETDPVNSCFIGFETVNLFSGAASIYDETVNLLFGAVSLIIKQRIVCHKFHHYLRNNESQWTYCQRLHHWFRNNISLAKSCITGYETVNLFSGAVLLVVKRWISSQELYC